MISENFLMNSKGFTYLKNENIIFDVFDSSFNEELKEQYNNKVIIGLYPLKDGYIPDFADGFGYMKEYGFDVIKVFSIEDFYNDKGAINSMLLLGFLFSQETILYINEVGESSILKTSRPFDNELIEFTIDKLKDLYPNIYREFFFGDQFKKIIIKDTKPALTIEEPKTYLGGYQSNAKAIAFRDRYNYIHEVYEYLNRSIV